MKTEREHVFPANLYPPSKSNSKIQRLTIDACRECNGSWADDEAHFRNVLMMAGDDPNPPRLELWQGPVDRSFDEPDAGRRIDDVLALIRTVQTKDGPRRMIFPAEDERVLRIVRKVIRGLAHHHGLYPFVKEHRVWVDVLKYSLPDGLLDGMAYHHREPDIAEYWYESFGDEEVDSAWLLRFFGSITFVGLINGPGDR